MILAIHTLLVSLTDINECVYVRELTYVLFEKKTEFLRTARTSFACLTGEISYFFRFIVMDFITEQRVVNVGLWTLVLHNNNNNNHIVESTSTN